ncbi:Arf17p [Stylosanthes scabra]|uniref:Auxin response factor n=1 Tax=Stylosanthes scabra TaxID=79078 RepID=A0ABU6S4M0_9FABA|nr:Arf17p [Stylosanthes scabra]
MPPRAPSTSALPSKPTSIPPKFWRACAGISAQEPPIVNSRVYYFPQGHIDQAASEPQNLSPLVYSTPFIHCRVSAVNFFADPNTDEVFLKILLRPVAGLAQDFPPIADAAEGNGDDEKVESYAKVLSLSDADNRGGFSVPKSCAEMIFPPLNSEDEILPQTFSMTDLHGTAWEFRHIYRGTPKRHLFTTGWKNFVDSKILISGDTLIFMKDTDGKVFVGIRRNMSLDEGEKGKEEVVMSEGFARKQKGRVSSASVAKAMELAAQNKPFEVVYYPNVGWGEFVLMAEDVEVKVNDILWRVGMKVLAKIRATFDSSYTTSFYGTVSGVSVPANDQPWSGSPWRMLQITWNDTGMLKKANFVSPWQVVELLSDAPSVPAALVPPTKKFRTTDGEEEPFLSRPTFPIPDSAKGLLKEVLLSCYGKTSPAGMQGQGARHDVSATPTCPIFPSNNSPMSVGNSSGNNIILPRLNTTLTEPNLDTQKRSFQLFGHTIQLEQPAADESGARDDGNNRAIDNK